MEELLDLLELEARARDAALPEAQRKARGVVHTPAAIARFVARSVERRLASLEIADGLSDRTLTLLDPATGPGIFLAALLERAREGRDAPAASLGLDIDPRAIERARAQLGRRFAAAGWPLRLEVRDALESVPEVAGPVVIVGNPPWTARSASRGATDALLDDFRRDSDGPMRDRKIGVLSDAYVRFVRWALAVLERSDRGGVIGFVTNGSFLDGEVHRGMRTWMARTLDRIDVIDLGGSALVARPAGARDENPFGVRPSVAITIMSRAPGAHRDRSARVRRLRIHGTKEEKLSALASLELDDARFEDVALVPPAMRFTKRAITLPSSWPSIEEWMPFHREGVQTNRDELVVGATREEVIEKVEAFVRGARGELARTHFDPAAARANLASISLDGWIVPIAYRPFDDRFVFTHPALCHRPRTPIAEAMAHAPIALVTSRRDRGDRPFRHLGVVFAPADNCYLSARSSCRARVFPLRAPDGTANLGVRDALEARVGACTLEEAFAYLVAFLGSATFRDRWDEALRRDPPRIPLPRDRATFERVARAGEAVIAAFRQREAVARTQITIGHWEIVAPVELETALLRADRAVISALGTETAGQSI